MPVRARGEQEAVRNRARPQASVLESQKVVLSLAMVFGKLSSVAVLHSSIAKEKEEWILAFCPGGSAEKLR